jgi:hypothetical protein
MNAYELVRAVQYLLEQSQANLRKEAQKLKISSVRQTEIEEEIREIEELVERSREGYQE